MKQKPYIWVTSVGQTLYENLNAYWAFCDQVSASPEKFVIFHASDMANQLPAIFNAMTTISDAYNEDADAIVQPVAFDDENIHSFRTNAESFMDAHKTNHSRMIIDISPTTWSFVPVYFMQLAQQYKQYVQSVLYLQYANHQMREMPYPLIPVNSLTLNNLLS